MKLRLWTAILSSLVLVSGCVPPASSYGDIARPMLFGGEATIDWLAEYDEPLLRQIVTHNEQVAALAK
jgi:hypothetical protein